MSSENRSVTETTVTFRATSSDVSKLNWINDVLSSCGQVEIKNTSETLRWGIGFIFKVLKHVTDQRASGKGTSSLAVDLSFLQLIIK